MNRPCRNSFPHVPDLRRELEDAFDALIDTPWGRSPNGPWMPAVDIEETEKAYYVTVDLPGVCTDDVQLRVRRREIDIRGSRSAVRRMETAHRIHTERITGHFRRTFHLNHAVEPESATWRCAEGVYEVEIKKRPEDENP